MVAGFNHNFAYRGTVYHVQTEDHGQRNPTVVTLLYRGGTVVASRKLSYADILLTDNLADAVEELMKEQHKGMLRSLKSGEFDGVIDRFEQAVPSAPAPAGSNAAAAPPVRRSAVFAPGLEQLVLSYLKGEER